MRNKTKKEIKKQHIDSYKNTIIEIIKNNTNSLVDDDIKSLIKKPPLDSMDLIKSKFLALAKKHKIVLKNDELDKIIDNYRKEVLNCCEDIKKIRISKLSNKVKMIKFTKDNDVIKINKKDFVVINKEIKKTVKDKASVSIDKVILKNIELIFDKDIDPEIINKVVVEITKYLKKAYLHQLLENIDIKILVKDTTLINSTKEQAERYIFTLNNSRLLND